METAEISRLINQCEAMEYGPSRTRLAQQIKALADENSAPWNRIASCYDLACSYVMSDDSAKALPICAEYFQLLEAYPSKSPHNPVFTLYLAELSANIPLDLPQISKEQCKALLDQFETYSKRYQQATQSFHRAEFLYYRTMGEMENASHSLERFRREGLDQGRDCESCRQGTVACALLDLSRRAEAIEVARPLLTGNLKCRHGVEPRRIVTALLYDALERGLGEAAAEYAARLSHMSFQDRGDLHSLSALLLYRADGDGEPGRSLRLLEKGSAWSIGMWNMDDLYHFYRGAWVFCKRLSEKCQNIYLGLPSNFPLYHADGHYEVKVLMAWFHAQAMDIAQKFDRRNGTDWYARNMEQS